MKKITRTAVTAALLYVGTGFAQSNSGSVAGVEAPTHIRHEYSAYEKLILKNVSEFHKNYNDRNFKKNGDLVTDDLHVNSNGTELHGRAAYVDRIQRLVGSFPDVRLTDLTTVVDGNTAAIRFIMTGTQKGDLQTPDGVIPATNRTIQVDGAEFFTFNKEGKLTDLVTIENLGQLMQELKAKQ